jgi:hypothetical protein
MMATGGPRSKTEARNHMAAAAADWLESQDIRAMFEGPVTPVQRARAEEAAEDVVRRLRALVKEPKETPDDERYA